jgi:hypothetical protein
MSPITPRHQRVQSIPFFFYNFLSVQKPPAAFSHISALISINVSSLDRLPTISASQALREIDSPQTSGSRRCRRRLLTNLRQLDYLSHRTSGGGSSSSSRSSSSAADGIICRKQITEIFGPPGVGKTTFGLVFFLFFLHSPFY